MKNLILVDFGPEQKYQFDKHLEKYTGIKSETKCKQSNQFHGGAVQNLLRFVCYFVYPLIWSFSYRKYNQIIGWQQFYGINYAFWLRVFHRKGRKNVNVMTFIYKPKGGFAGKIYDKYMRYAVTSKYINKLIVFSSKEVELYSNYFGISKDRICYIPLGNDFNSVVANNDVADKYIFGTGRSNRDWDFVINSLNDTEYKVQIACDGLNKVSSDNVTILDNCFFEETDKRMAEAYCVVVPLKDINVSSGQLVILQAMCYGKPVIATRCGGSCDYIEDGKTGILINNNQEELLAALEKLYSDKEFYKNISDNALNYYLANHTEEKMAENIAKAITI